MRVAIIHVGWPIQAHMRDLVGGLVSEGHDVTFVGAAEDDCGMVALDSFQGHVEIIRRPLPVAVFDRRLRRRIGAAIPGMMGTSGWWVRREVGRVLARRGRMDLLMGVEKAGLDVAAWWGEATQTRFLYYSLELYLEDHPALRRFAWQRRRERQCHARACATLIQDRSRWDVLRAANGVLSEQVHFLPIGVADPEPPATEGGRPRARTKRNPFTLLSFGLQGPGRFTRELIDAASSLPAGMLLHLHGPVFHRPTRRLAEGALPANVRFVTQLLSEKELPDLFASADIGLALYLTSNANDRLTAFSSHKIALYLQAGLPIVAFRTAAYAELFSRFRCGEMIDDLGQLGAAAQRIGDEYASYSTAARAAFEGIYRLDRQWEGLSRFVESLVPR